MRQSHSQCHFLPTSAPVSGSSHSLMGPLALDISMLCLSHGTQIGTWETHFCTLETGLIDRSIDCRMKERHRLVEPNDSLFNPENPHSEEVDFAWRRSTIGTQIETDQPASPNLSGAFSAEQFESRFRV